MSRKDSSYKYFAAAAGMIAVGACVSAIALKDTFLKGQEAVPQSIDRMDTVESEKEFEPGAIAIYFGSQTGTAEEFAREIKDFLAERHIHADVIDLEVCYRC